MRGRELGWLREGSIPLRFQGGVAAPLIKRSRSLAAQTGWLVDSNKNKVRYADIYTEATRPFINHPVCAAKERALLIEAQPPFLENGGEWSPLAANPIAVHARRNLWAVLIVTLSRK